MAKWRTCKLGDLLEIKHGFAFLGEHFASAGTHIVLTPGNFLEEGGFKEKTDKAKWYNGPIPDDYVLNQGDLIVAMTEQAEGLLGSAAIIPRNDIYLHNQRLGLVQIGDRKKVDQLFVYYLFNSKPVRQQIRASASGVKIRHTAPSRIAEVKVSIPPLPIQRRIASILSAYDELIENNQKRIKILEEMARALYREWFVYFRFPGHENVPRVVSPLGEIPEGWEVKKLAEVADVNRVQINARTAPDELHYIDISSVSPGQIDSRTTYSFADAPGRARRIVQHGDVLWSCVRRNRRSHAQVMHPESNTIASTGFAVLSATKVPFTFLYFATTTDDFVAFLTNNATGAAYPAVTAPTFEKADLLIPPALLLKKFGDATIPMAEQIHTLQRQIQNLRQTRDLLLPRLLSGQINLNVEMEILEEASHAQSAPVTYEQEPTPLRIAAEPSGKKETKPVSEAEHTAPPPIDQTDRAEVLSVIRQVFGDGQSRDRETAYRDIAHALGYKRTGSNIRSILNTDIITAVRRGILVNEHGELRVLTRTITDYQRDFLKEQFIASLSRTWTPREDAIRDFARWLGFSRTGKVIEETAQSLINGLLREGRMEKDGGMVRRG